jgi:hypothetical protein
VPTGPFPQRLIFGDPCVFEQGRERFALVCRDCDNPPWRKLAMVGRAQRERDDVAQFVGVGAGAIMSRALPERRVARCERRVLVSLNMGGI